MAQNIGFIGLGSFGARIASRLTRQDIGVLVYDSWIEPVRYFMLKHTADMGESPRMLAALCDIVACVLPDAQAVREIAIGRLGLREGLKDGRTCILLDLGAKSSAEARALADELAPHGVIYVEAPARGSPEDARDGRLTIPVGGPADAVEKVMPVLRAVSAKAAHVGEVGSAHVISALVEQVRAASLMAFAEALGVGAGIGVSRTALRDWCMEEGLLGPAIASLAEGSARVTGRSFEALVHNLGLLETLSRDNGLAPPLGGLVTDMWRQAQGALGPQRDIEEVEKWIAGAIRIPSGPAGEA